MHPGITRGLEWLSDALWPIACLACAQPARGCGLCDPCAARIVADPGVACGRCLARVDDATALCGRCRHHPPAFGLVRALGPYEPHRAPDAPLVRAVRALKYDRRRRVATALGALLAAHYPFDAAALVVPVPLHPARLRERGFNQAALLAGVLGRRRGLAVGVDALARSRSTATQAALASAPDRQRNLAAAFRVRRPALIRGRTVVLVDDVVTTGATANACALALRDAGAACVHVYAVGRTP